MTNRSPEDGEPFYCTTCGAGFGEFVACDGIDCAIETVAAARKRRTERLALRGILADALASAEQLKGTQDE